MVLFLFSSCASNSNGGMKGESKEIISTQDQLIGVVKELSLFAEATDRLVTMVEKDGAQAHRGAIEKLQLDIKWWNRRLNNLKLNPAQDGGLTKDVAETSQKRIRKLVDRIQKANARIRENAQGS